MSELAQKSGKLRKIVLRRRDDDDVASTEQTPAIRPTMTVGCAVRLYYDEETFDEGEVKALDDANVYVDFYDWIERWPSTPTQFALHELYYEYKSVWVPTGAGEVITDFRLTTDGKILSFCT